jgi:hypothetical protein
MRSSCRFTLVLVMSIGFVSVAHPADFTEVGFTSEPGLIETSPSDDCFAPLMHHHDMTFENGFAWHYGGVEPPYYGAFGEGFAPQWDFERFGVQGMPQNVSPEGIECAVFWFSHLGQYSGHTCDVYIWEGGVTCPPAAVLLMVPDFDPGSPAFWPNVSEHYLYLGFAQHGVGECTVGYWGNWPGQGIGWYVAADCDGFIAGNSWTCLAPGSGYGTGWVDPAVVWGPFSSLGIGYTGSGFVQTKNSTWGGIKSLFEQ